MNAVNYLEQHGYLEQLAVYPECVTIKHFSLRAPTASSCELSVTTDRDGHRVLELSYGQLRLLTLEAARILACWQQDETPPASSKNHTLPSRSKPDPIMPDHSEPHRT